MQLDCEVVVIIGLRPLNHNQGEVVWTPAEQTVV